MGTNESQDDTNAAELGLLGLRLVAGGLLAGHGAMKLFGSFGGPGFQGTAGWMESMGFTPGERWAALAGASEFGGGLLTALGLLHPIGPIGTIAAMTVAARDAHAGKPIWVTEGGAELPIINIAIATALATTGPGRFSLDNALGIRVPKGLVALATVAVAAGLVYADMRPRPEAAPEDARSAEPGNDHGGEDSVIGHEPAGAPRLIANGDAEAAMATP